MKKIVCVLLVLLTLCGCSGEKVEEIKFGETVSTDMVDFTFDSAKFSYYASSVLDETYASPVEFSDGIFVASAGHVLVCMEFTITNKDRASLNMGTGSSDWPLSFGLNYKGEHHSIQGYDLNNKDGLGYLRLDFGCQIKDGKMKKGDSVNDILQAGETKTYRVVGITNFDPDSLDDTFGVEVKLPNSEKKEMKFTFTK